MTQKTTTNQPPESIKLPMNYATDYFQVIEDLKPRSLADEKKVFDRFLYSPQRKRHNGAFRLSDAIRNALSMTDPMEKLNALKDCKKTLIEIRTKIGQIKK